MTEGFFPLFVEDVEKVIDEHFTQGSTIDVKHIRKIMGISSKNRSKTAFLSRALENLSKKGRLKYIGRKTTKRYKKI